MTHFEAYMEFYISVTIFNMIWWLVFINKFVLNLRRKKQWSQNSNESNQISIGILVGNNLV